MHVVTNTEPATINSDARRVGGGATNGLTWTAFRIVDNFCFTVASGQAVLHTSATEFATAPKAERAAQEWCASYVVPSAAANIPEPAGVVSGWTVRIEDDRGAYKAVLEAPDRDTEVLRGFEHRADAIKAAAEWASSNPCDGSPPFAAPSDDADPSTPFDDDAPAHSYSEPGPAPQTAASDEATSPAPAPVPDLAPTPTTPPEPSRDWSTVDEVWTLLAERDAVDDRLALAEAAKQRAAAQAKEIRSELEELDARIRVARNNAERQRVLPLHPAPRTFATSEAVRAKIGADAATWAFNGVEHRVLHEQVPSSDGPRFVAWLDGHRPLTEGHGETLEQAIEASRLAASSMWADADPGQTTPSVDAGAVADGPRKPAKRGRPAKLKGHDKAAVIAAVESVLTWPEAAALLSCTTDQLEKFAAKVGINLTKHQGRRAGEELALPEAPQAKAGKPRGRRKVGAK